MSCASQTKDITKDLTSPPLFLCSPKHQKRTLACGNKMASRLHTHVFRTHLPGREKKNFLRISAGKRLSIYSSQNFNLILKEGYQLGKLSQSPPKVSHGYPEGKVWLALHAFIILGQRLRSYPKEEDMANKNQHCPQGLIPTPWA